MSDDNEDDEFDHFDSCQINDYNFSSSIFEPEQEIDVQKHGTHLISFALMTVTSIFENIIKVDPHICNSSSINFEEISQSTELSRPKSDYNLCDNNNTISSFHWIKSKTIQDFIKMDHLHLCLNKDDQVRLDLDLKDDPELRCCLDYHNIITTELLAQPDHIPTADEVIQELDEILDFCHPENGNSGNSHLCSLSYISSSDDSGFSQSFTEVGLMGLSLSQLNGICESAEVHIAELSSELVHQLALRDEYVFHQEELERFLSQLHEVHKRLDQRVNFSTRSFTMCEKDKPTTLWSSFPGLKRNKSTPNTNVVTDGQESSYLTISIPYHARDCSTLPPPVEVLQAYNRILSAMLSHNPLLHSYLTDYILNVYAPNISRPMSLPL